MVRCIDDLNAEKEAAEREAEENAEKEEEKEVPQEASKSSTASSTPQMKVTVGSAAHKEDRGQRCSTPEREKRE